MINENENNEIYEVEMEENELGGGFGYSNIGMEEIEDTDEFTLVSIAIDTTGSVHPFKKDLEDTVKALIDDCKRHNRSENLLIRVTSFDERPGDNVREIHGFKLPATINDNDYTITTGGMTPLYDATGDAISAIENMADKLRKEDHLCNAVVYIITDGVDNAYSQTFNADSVDKKIKELKSSEKLLGFESGLIGVNDKEWIGELDRFKNKCNLDHYKSCGDVITGGLGTAGSWISEHISSTSTKLSMGVSQTPTL
jgi:hypothetical protein